MKREHVHGYLGGAVALVLIVTAISVRLTHQEQPGAASPTLPPPTTDIAAIQYLHDPETGESSVPPWTGLDAESPPGPPPPPLAALVGDVMPTRDGKTCTIKEWYLPAQNGMVARAVSCEPDQDPAGEYELLDNDTLAQMSWNDAGAASELSVRLRESAPDMARDYALNAVALDPTDIRPLYMAALNTTGPGADRRQGRTRTEGLAIAYVLHRVAEEISGEPREPALRTRDELFSAGVTEEQMAGLEERVTEKIRRIEEIQLMTTGESTVAGLLQ